MIIYGCLLFYTIGHDISLRLRKSPGCEAAMSYVLTCVRTRPQCDVGGPRAGRPGFRSRRSAGRRTVVFGCKGSVRLRSGGCFVAVGDGFQWVSEAGTAPQLDFHE